ncbi:MAG: tetratricopeptide repeat protein, partial [Kiritimatiellia bacterium]
KAGVVPAATYLIAGIGIALLTASWRALALLDDPVDVEIPFDKEDDDEPPLPHPLARSTTILFNAGRGVGLMAMPILVVAILVAGVLNVRWLVADNGAFADRAADEVLDGLGQRDWVVANGIIDANLLIRAQERGQTVRLLCPYRAREANYTDAVRRAFTADTRFTESTRLRAQSLMAYSFHLFIDDLFAADEAIAEKAVSMGLPDLWYGAGRVPVPERLFYGGVQRAEAILADELEEEHRAFWVRWQGFVAQGEGNPRQLGYRYRGALLRHMAFVANNAGVTLDDLGRPEAAFEAYRKAREIYPDNISALLNLFDAVARGMHPEMKEAVERQLRDKVERGKDRYPLWSLSRHYGYVRNVELFVRMGWQWALSSSPGSVLAGLRSAYAMQKDEQKRAALSAMMASLYEMRGDFKQSAAEYKKTLARDPKNTFAISGLARLALQRSVVDEARTILEVGEKAGAPRRQLRQDWAALYLVGGDLPRARVLLQEMAEEPDVAPMTLAMLAMVMIEQDDIGAVETKVLPRLVKANKGQDGYFAQVIQGRVWQSKGSQGLKNARLCFQRAALIRPDVQPLLDVLLSLDVSLEDQKSAEARALTILRQRPDHPYASFIMGTIRLEQGQYGDAEGYLRRSVAGEKPPLAALNNFAEVLCRIRKLDEAEKTARQAVERAPDRYEGWATLAYVLAEKNRPDPAAEALAKARQIHAEDGRLNVVDALIAVKRGNPDAAEQALARAGTGAVLSVADRRAAASVREAIARLRQGR